MEGPPGVSSPAEKCYGAPCAPRAVTTALAPPLPEERGDAQGCQHEQLDPDDATQATNGSEVVPDVSLLRRRADR